MADNGDEHPSAAEAPSLDEDPHEHGRRRRGGTRIPRKRLSEILAEIAQDPSRDEVGITDLIAILGGRGRAALILIFAFPNVLPAPPGVSGILGLPLLYLCFQMMMSRQPWLPRFIGARSVPRDRFAQLMDGLGPVLERAERLLRPRWSVLVSHSAERVLGAVCLVLAIVLSLPIPFGNMLPAFAICLIALGVLERDGVWVTAGLAAGALALAIVAGVVYAIVRSIVFLLLNAFS